MPGKQEQGCTKGGTQLFKETYNVKRIPLTNNERNTSNRLFARRVNPCDLPRLMRAKRGFNIR